MIQIQRSRLAAMLAGTLLFRGLPALSHDPLYVIVENSVSPPRLAIAPGSQAILAGETAMNFAASGVYAAQYVTDLPAYDATLFPFGSYPGVQLLLERVHFPAGFGMYQAAGSTVPVLTSDGATRAFTGHTHYVHHTSAPGIFKASFRFLDGSGQLVASDVFAVTFRAYRAGVDTDGDGVLDQFDNCITVSNASQSDLDADTVGDACDDCPAIPDRNQLDLNLDGQSDACNCGGVPCLRGDVNFDGVVDAIDLAFCAARFSANRFPPAPPADLVCDLNHDGRIDALDLVEIAVRMPGHISSGGTGVPVNDP